MKLMFKKYSPSALLMGLLIVLSVSCKEKESEIDPYSSITTNESGPTATDTNPAVATADHPVQLTWSQTSTYTDYDSKVVTCSPKASINMTVAQPHITVKDVKELTNLKETLTENKTQGTTMERDKTTGKPTVYNSSQTYEIGGQTIKFDLSYEQYSYKNKHDLMVTMPYMQLGKVKYGEPKPDLKEAAKVPDLPYVTSIKIRPARDTRGSLILKDLYDVTVNFNLETETKEELKNGTSKSTKHTYSFQASYQATVENVFEYPEPTTSMTYSFKQSADSTAKSPYIIRGGEQLELEWSGQSRHVWFDVEAMEQKLFSGDPHAQIKVSLALDTLEAYNTSRIEDMIANVSASDPAYTDEGTEHKGHRTWTIIPANEKMGKQVMTLDWAYTRGDTVTTSYGKIPMPYLMVSDPEFIEVKIKRIEDDPNIPETVKLYEVTARIKQTFSVLNDSSLNNGQPYKEEIEYQLKYMIVENIMLTKVAYRKDWKWLEPTDSTALAFYPIVYRDRTYSNSETFTDTFIDDPHFVNWTSVIGPAKYTDKGGSFQWGSKNKIVYKAAEYSNKDTIFSSSVIVGVPRVAYESTKIVSDGYKTAFPGMWEEYIRHKNYGPETAVPLEGVEVVGNFEKSTRSSGWYIFEPQYYRQLDIIYNDPELEDGTIVNLGLTSNFIDSYLVIDGFKVTFLEGRSQMNLSYKDEKVSYESNSARQITHEGSTTYFGKRFKVSSTAIVYQMPAGSQDSIPSNPSTPSDTTATTRSVSTTSRASALRHLPAPYARTPRFIYGGKPKGVKGRY